MGGPGGGPAQGPRSNPKIKEIMTKIGKGPQALQGFLGEAIKQSEPAWETIQPKTREFAQLAAELKDLEPTRGTKDSWAKLSLAFAESAAELDHAAQSKDKNQTKETLDTLGSSCMACHRAHRTMGPGMGGPRGGRGMGPPPGGFGGPPPGDPHRAVQAVSAARLQGVPAVLHPAVSAARHPAVPHRARTAHRLSE